LVKLYRLFKLMRMAKIIKLFNNKTGSLVKIASAFDISLGTRRLIFLTLIMLIL
jgi:hypothetical protein